MTHPFSGSEVANKTGTTSGRKNMVIRLAVWLLFGVVIGLLPLIARIIQDAMSKDRFSFTEVFRSGERFIVSAVLAAGAMGELFAGSVSSRLSGALRTSELWPRLLTILAGFWTLLAFAANTMAYMAVPTAPQSTVMHLSLAFFPITVLASGLSIGTAYGQ